MSFELIRMRVAVQTRLIAALAALVLLMGPPAFSADTGSPPAANGEFERAYQALAGKDYDEAIGYFEKGLAGGGGNAAIHKNLAYTLLKIGENARARDEFQKALTLNAGDETAALEYAFLAYETKKPIEARRMFDTLRYSGSAQTRATAEQAYQNIDRPLADGIKRWQEAIAQLPDPNAPASYSAHWELANTAELRDEPALAAEQYRICRRIKPEKSELLLDLGRVWIRLNRIEDGRAALLAASRSTDSRTAEMALTEWGTRYPFPYEFLSAIKLDPRNVALRRELGYLYLAMNKEAEATEQFEAVLKIDPGDSVARRQLDLLRGLKSRPSEAAATSAAQAVDAKALGKKSLSLGYLRDAVKYLEQAHEQHPEDAEVMLALGWAYNQSRNDAEAIAWFDRARRADDPQVAAQASKAFHNLNGDTLPQTTIWTLPMFSTRWKDVFSYGQVKRTVPIPGLRKANKVVQFYLSARFVGDVKGVLPTHVLQPQYLSEDSFIFGAGVASRTWHHLTGWAEAGEAVKFLPQRHDVGAAIPDYRGGLNFARGFGSLLGASRSGMFYETTADAIYLSRFDKDWLFYSQHRVGRTFRFGEGLSAQLLMNANYVADLKREYWANTVELGPGLRLRLPYMPPRMSFAADYLHGFYTETSPRPNYTDVRLGIWYAVTK